MNRPVSPVRTLGYRLLGRRLDYLLHLRPAEWPIMAGHTLLGALLALGLHGSAIADHAGPLLFGLVLWVVALNGGTLAINSAWDRDEGDVAYLRQPPPPPPALFAFGTSLMLLGLGLSLLLPRSYSVLYAVCLLMSFLYSVPPARLKSVAGADWVINFVGFGSLTLLAGWASTGEPISRWGWLLAGAFGALFAGFYPLTQLYQFDEDRLRGDRTFALMLGKRVSLLVAMASVLLAFAIFALAAQAAGWSGQSPRRWLVLSIALVAWVSVLLPWYSRAESRPPAFHQRGMYLALGAWALTDLAVLYGWAFSEPDGA